VLIFGVETGSAITNAIGVGGGAPPATVVMMYGGTGSVALAPVVNDQIAELLVPEPSFATTYQ